MEAETEQLPSKGHVQTLKQQAAKLEQQAKQHDYVAEAYTDSPGERDRVLRLSQQLKEQAAELRRQARTPKQKCFLLNQKLKSAKKAVDKADHEVHLAHAEIEGLTTELHSATERIDAAKVRHADKFSQVFQIEAELEELSKQHLPDDAGPDPVPAGCSPPRNFVFRSRLVVHPSNFLSKAPPGRAVRPDPGGIAGVAASHRPYQCGPSHAGLSWA